jgi:dephospho-CoA kinase
MGHKLVVGLIGGIGSGKSRVAEELARRGAQVIVGDQLGHEALRQPEVRDRVLQRWPQVRDEQGAVSRRRLGQIVFADDAELRALEEMVFPYIKRRITEEVAAAQANERARLIVLDAAVLLEAGWDFCCDRIVYVHATRAVRLRRLAEQRGWTAKEVEARARAQLPLTAKARRADFAVHNDGPPELLAPQIDDLLTQLNLVAPADGRGGPVSLNLAT